MDLILSTFAKWCQIPLVILLSTWIIIGVCKCGHCIQRCRRWAARNKGPLRDVSPFFVFSTGRYGSKRKTQRGPQVLGNVFPLLISFISIFFRVSGIYDVQPGL